MAKLDLYKNETVILSLGLKACCFLLTDRNLINKINIKKLISNKKIIFNSDVNIFYDLFFLLTNDINLNIEEIKKRLIKKINILNNNFLFILTKMSKDILEIEFMTVIDKILLLK